MINIKINNEYKSIKPCEFELPNFSVLTGLNGSGKTHLLEAMSNNQLSDIIINGNKLTKILYIQFNGLNPKIPYSCDPKTISDFVKSFHRRLYEASIKASRMKKNVINLLAAPKDKQIAEKILFEITKDPDKITEDDILDIFDVSWMSKDDFFTKSIRTNF